MLQRLRDLVGPSHVLTAPDDTAPYLTDWRRRFTGRAQAVVLPAATAEVAAVVQACAEHRTPVVPQGGNTGLVGGATPLESGDAIVLSLKRMNRMRTVDALNNTITVEAGCVLRDVQQAAHDAERLFPLSLAAEGSA
ncbi:MAG TPA: FAD-binding oxidoreductase, partial [Burkholderiaceae bacterium]|nr:FAD-binding oxidoreductase [Burkholderiaceae bacterium]